MNITNHTQLLQALIDKHNLKSYLEIGVQNPRNNFSHIKIEGPLFYTKKVAVDPNVNIWGSHCNGFLHSVTSDEFFNFNTEKFDLIFIDGDHSAEQVKKDFENSLHCLSDNGFIVIHDVLPENEEGTLIPRVTRKWWGDVYKFAMTIRKGFGYPVQAKTFNIDEGCMLVWKAENNIGPLPFNFIADWKTYKKMGRQLLNVVDEVII